MVSVPEVGSPKIDSPASDLSEMDSSGVYNPASSSFESENDIPGAVTLENPPAELSMEESEDSGSQSPGAGPDNSALEVAESAGSTADSTASDGTASGGSYETGSDELGSYEATSDESGPYESGSDSDETMADSYDDAEWLLSLGIPAIHLNLPSNTNDSGTFNSNPNAPASSLETIAVPYPRIHNLGCALFDIGVNGPTDFHGEGIERDCLVDVNSYDWGIGFENATIPLIPCSILDHISDSAHEIATMKGIHFTKGIRHYGASISLPDLGYESYHRVTPSYGLFLESSITNEKLVGVLQPVLVVEFGECWEFMLIMIEHLVMGTLTHPSAPKGGAVRYAIGIFVDNYDRRNYDNPNPEFTAVMCEAKLTRGLKGGERIRVPWFTFITQDRSCHAERRVDLRSLEGIAHRSQFKDHFLIDTRKLLDVPFLPEAGFFAHKLVLNRRDISRMVIDHLDKRGFIDLQDLELDMGMDWDAEFENLLAGQVQQDAGKSDDETSTQTTIGQ